MSARGIPAGRLLSPDYRYHAAPLYKLESPSQTRIPMGGAWTHPEVKNGGGKSQTISQREKEREKEQRKEGEMKRGEKNGSTKRPFGICIQRPGEGPRKRSPGRRRQGAHRLA